MIEYTFINQSKILHPIYILGGEQYSRYIGTIVSNNSVKIKLTYMCTHQDIYIVET